MFERFTERARKVVVLAQDEAARLRHDYIGTEHLLLGLIREEEGVAALSLDAWGVTLDGVRGRVGRLVGYGEEPPGQQVPFKPRSKRVLEAALEEALGLGHDHIGTEHLLLGLLREPEGVAVTVLSDLGVNPEAVRREVLGRLGGGTGSGRQAELGPLGWAREALQRSFGRYPRGEARASFEAFTGPARKVVVLAQEEARHFNHNYIGTEHILLGLIREEESVAARALGQAGVRLDEARERVESIVGCGEEQPVGAQLPFTPRVNKAFQMAILESAQLDHDHVGPEHILLGLVRESEGVAARVLSDLDVDADKVRRGVIRKLPDGPPENDSLGEVERGMEEGEGWTLFRGRVTGVRGELAVPGSLTVSVDADYAYRVPPLPRDASTVQVSDVLEAVRNETCEMEARSVEAAVGALGGPLLAAFPGMLEVTVTVSGVPDDSSDATFSVSATFRR